MDRTGRSTGLTPAQVEFFASEQLVEFIPVVDAPAIPTLSGYLGPFIAGKSLQVPVWLALQMEEKNWGRTVTPNWLRNPQLLNALREAEKNNPDEFCPVPQHYMELTQLFLKSCQKPISQQVLSLVDLLWSERAEKRRGGVEGADLVNTLAFRLDNLTMLEANHFRRIAQLALDFNLDAKMAHDGEAAPPELESLNRRRGNLAELLGLNNIPRLSQSDPHSGQRFSLQSRSTFGGPASGFSGSSVPTSQQTNGGADEEEEEEDLSRRPWMGGSEGAPPSSKLRRI